MIIFKRKGSVMKKTKEPPCKDCLCVPVCKGKTYASMHKECSLVKMYLYKSLKTSTASNSRNPFFNDRVFMVFEEVKPNNWRVVRRKEKDGNGKKTTVFTISIRGKSFP